jgi:hypothetical protein
METITVNFEIGETPWVLRDAIVVSKSVYDTMTPADIEKEKADRYARWIAIANPPEEEVNG